MKRLGQGRGSALKAMVPLHFPFRCICGVQLFHIEEDKDAGGRRRVEREKKGGGGRDSLGDWPTQNCLLCLVSLFPDWKWFIFQRYFKSRIQGRCQKLDKEIYVNMHFDNIISDVFWIFCEILDLRGLIPISCLCVKSRAGVRMCLT